MMTAAARKARKRAGVAGASWRPGFTLLEVMVATTIIAVIAVVFMPMMRDDTRLRLMAASSILTSDIELAQVMSISYPGTTVVVRFDAANRTYWLAYADDPDTPIARADTGEPYRVVLGAGRASAASGVEMTLTDLAGDTLEFNAQGGLVDMTAAPSVQLSRDFSTITLSINVSTGTVTETGGETEAP